MSKALLAAKEAVEIAREEPAAALQRADDLLANHSDPEICARAHFAKGLAHRTLANGGESTRYLETGAAIANGELRGQILRSLAFNYAQAGKHHLADQTIAESIDLLAGQQADLSRLQQAFMLLMRGDHQAALPVLSAAVNGFSNSGDEDYLELTLFNRALIYTEFGEYARSIDDLERAYEIGVRLGHNVSAADAALHLSQVKGWQDDVPDAMRWHARSVELRSAADAANPVADAEHAFVLIQARLMREAEEALRDAIPRLVAAGGNEASAAAGRLMLAEVLADRGAHGEALRQIALAAAESPSDGRWRFDLAAAEHRVRMLADDISPDLLSSMLRTADEMERNGEAHSAAMERFRAVAAALACNDLPTARTLAAGAERMADTGPLWLQAQAWTALARVRFAAGDRRGASAAVRAGMRRINRYRSGIGATDLRLHATDWGADLAMIGLRIAVESGSPARVFDWSEQSRATAQPGRPTDPDLELALADLRRLTASLRTAGGETSSLRRQLAMAERRVNTLARQAAGAETASSVTRLSKLQASLNDRTLISFVQLDAQIHAVVIDQTSSRLVATARMPEVIDTAAHLRFAAERIARPATSDASRIAAMESATASAQLLGQLLIEPMQLNTSKVVVLPTGALHEVPWSLVVDRPVELAPSATSWLRAKEQSARKGDLLVVPGPGLEHAAAEAQHIATTNQATVAATITETLHGLATARAAHFACHARARADNPMFSSLVLADGEINLHDIERLPQVPDRVVLAACSGGDTVLTAGDEVLSLAGSFLALGARTVLAPLFAVSDFATNELMRRLYELLAEEMDVSTALHTIRNSAGDEVAFTAGSFLCFGVG